MAIFTLFDGDTWEVKGATGKYLEVLVFRQYLDRVGFENVVFSDALSDYKGEEQVTERDVTIGNLYTGERYEEKRKYVLAVNKNYQEFPPLDYYDGTTYSNGSSKMKIEVILQGDEIYKRILLNYEGKGFNFLDMSQQVHEEIIERAFKGKLEDQGVWAYEDYIRTGEEGPLKLVVERSIGQYDTTFVTEEELENLICSIRLVEFDFITNKRSVNDDKKTAE